MFSARGREKEGRGWRLTLFASAQGVVLVLSLVFCFRLWVEQGCGERGLARPARGFCFLRRDDGGGLRLLDGVKELYNCKQSERRRAGTRDREG